MRRSFWLRKIISFDSFLEARPRFQLDSCLLSVFHFLDFHCLVFLVLAEHEYACCFYL